MEAMFEDDLMDEEIHKFVLNMTPYSNGEGSQTWIMDSQQPTGGHCSTVGARC